MTLTYLYRCYDSEGQLLYAGITDDWEVRRRSHAKEKFWWGDVVRVEKMAFETRDAAFWAEWAVITTCRPTYNKQILLPSVPNYPPPVVLADEEYETFGRVGAAKEAFLRLFRRRREDDPVTEVELPEVRIPRVATTVRRPPTPERLPAPAPVAKAAPVDVLDAPAVKRPATPVDSSRARTRTLELIGEAGLQGVVAGVLERRLAAEGLPIPEGEIVGWLHGWMRTGLICRTKWDTFARFVPPDPDEPVLA